MCEARITAGISGTGKKVDSAVRKIGFGERVAGYKCKPPGMPRWISALQVSILMTNP